ncbi:MAG: asparagine synthase-related protein [Syntrophotaleaceae bacterium]
MPGICGMLEFHKRQENALSFRNGVENTLHFPTYSCEKKTESDFSIARIDINNRKSRSVFFDHERKLIITFWGDLFQVDDRNESGEPAQNPEIIIGRLYQNSISTSDLASKLNGDFNCAIYDLNLKKLFIFNDRFGFRRLYYYKDKNVFLFSHELKFFITFYGFNKQINWQSVSDFLRYSYVLGDRTLFQEVSVLPPASCLEVSSNSLSLCSYWTPRYENSLGLSDLDYAVDQGLSFFQQSLHRRIGNSQKILIFLTGGLDSRLITAVSSQTEVDITTSTQGSFFSYEYELAKKVCKTLEIPPPKRFTASDGWLREYFKNMAWQSEAQYGSCGLAWQHGLDNCLGNNFDRMLNGIFGGHLSFGSPYFSEQDTEANYSYEQQITRIDKGLNGHRYSYLIPFLNENIKKIVNDYGCNTIKQEMDRVKNQSNLPYFQQDALFLYNRIRRGMISIDQNHLYFDDQYPFASYELFGLYLKLKPELLLNHRLYKELYKKHYPDLAKIPWWSTCSDLHGRTDGLKRQLKSLCQNLEWYVGKLSRGRLCLPHPWVVKFEDRNFRRDVENRRFLYKILTSDQAKERKIFNCTMMSSLLNNCLRSQISMDEIGKLVMLEMWFQYFIDENPCY